MISKINRQKTELLACPFCGGKAELRKRTLFEGALEGAYIKCCKCDAMSQIANAGITVAFKGMPSRCITMEEVERRVEKQWNTRTELFADKAKTLE